MKLTKIETIYCFFCSRRLFPNSNYATPIRCFCSCRFFCYWLGSSVQKKMEKTLFRNCFLDILYHWLNSEEVKRKSSSFLEVCGIFLRKETWGPTCLTKAKISLKLDMYNKNMFCTNSLMNKNHC